VLWLQFTRPAGRVAILGRLVALLMKTDSCPKCGSTEREPGKLYEPGRVTDIRFKADAAPILSYKKKVTALACSKCGYIEFYLSDHDTGDDA